MAQGARPGARLGALSPSVQFKQLLVRTANIELRAICVISVEESAFCVSSEHVFKPLPTDGNERGKYGQSYPSTRVSRVLKLPPDARLTNKRYIHMRKRPFKYYVRTKGGPLLCLLLMTSG
ncbi:hypothetical protein EVAR_51036_1 [Eumeta japonica]|uniref:Uncharacterized protein n=1 Tax=Eumeta variegata TaxID=151549 RepID=A0A4C1Y865_EUMVA|nr:hypothetical protein EVAR_51036_1 [Eumeta japonica]